MTTAIPVQCEARVHAVVIDGHFLRQRCTERSCPDVIAAKARGERAFHVWDLQTGHMDRTEFEPVRKEKSP